MSRTVGATASDSRELFVEVFLVNDHINRLLLDHLDPPAWRARTTGAKVRTIGEIFAHLHNVRCKWLRLSAPYLKTPARLDRIRCTQDETRAALSKSGAMCAEMLREGVQGSRARVKNFVRDGWSRSWPVGLAALSYMVAHEAHHRGQICMLAHQLGFPLAGKASYGIWQWERLWKECGFSHPR